VGAGGDLWLEETAVTGGVTTAIPGIPFSGDGGGLFKRRRQCRFN
jgi:hypothetical protein